MRTLSIATSLQASAAIYRFITSGLKRKFVDLRSALCTGQVDLIHLARSARTTTHSTTNTTTAILAESTVAITAIYRAITRRLERQLGDVSTAFSASAIHIEHLPVRTKSHICSSFGFPKCCLRNFIKRPCWERILALDLYSCPIVEISIARFVVFVNSYSCNV